MALKVCFLLVLIGTVAFVNCYPLDSSEESLTSSDKADAPAFVSDDETKTTTDSSESVEKRALNDPTVKPGNSQVPPLVEIAKEPLPLGQKIGSTYTSTSTTTPGTQQVRVRRGINEVSTLSTSTPKVSTGASTGKVPLFSTFQNTKIGENKNGAINPPQPGGLGILPPTIHE